MILYIIYTNRYTAISEIYLHNLQMENRDS